MNAGSRCVQLVGAAAVRRCCFGPNSRQQRNMLRLVFMGAVPAACYIPRNRLRPLLAAERENERLSRARRRVERITEKAMTRLLVTGEVVELGG